MIIEYNYKTMKKYIITALAILLIPTLSWATTVFKSDQVGSSPSNGRVLQTNGTTSTWVATSSLGITGGGGGSLSGTGLVTNVGTTQSTLSTTSIPINVKDYGAIGNNIADDTAAFNAAFNVATSSLRRSIYIPTGTYRITSTILASSTAWGTATIGDSFAIYGDGIARSVINCSSFNGDCLNFHNPSGFSGVWMHDFFVQGPGGYTNPAVTTSIGAGIHITAIGAEGANSDHGTIERIYSEGFKYGLYVEGGGTSLAIKSVDTSYNLLGTYLNGTAFSSDTIEGLTTYGFEANGGYNLQINNFNGLNQALTSSSTIKISNFNYVGISNAFVRKDGNLGSPAIDLDTNRTVNLDLIHIQCNTSHANDGYPIRLNGYNLVHLNGVENTSCTYPGSQGIYDVQRTNTVIAENTLGMGFASGVQSVVIGSTTLSSLSTTGALTTNSDIKSTAGNLVAASGELMVNTTSAGQGNADIRGLLGVNIQGSTGAAGTILALDTGNSAADGSPARVYSSYYNSEAALILGTYTNRANQLYLKTDGNVGIGTTNPTSKLTVNGSLSATGGSNILGSTALTGTLNLSGGVSDVPPGGKIDFGATYGGENILFYNGGAGSKYGYGLNGGEMQQFIIGAAGDHFSWNKGGQLNAIGTNEVMRLTGDTGLMGIGTTTPVARIDSYTTASSTSMLLEAVSGKGGCLMIQDVGSAPVTYTQIYTKAGVILSKVATNPALCN